jgi:hypothetical protein
VINSAWLRTKTIRVSSLTTYRNGKEGTTVEAFIKSNDLVFIFAVLINSPATSKLKCCFVSFRTRVGKVNFVRKCRVVKLFTLMVLVLSQALLITVTTMT